MTKQRAAMATTEIENTTATAFGNPLLGMIMCDSGAIEASERQGQAQIVASMQLPTKMQDPREHFEALGFKFGAPAPGDKLFCAATLPAGWTKRGSDHAMWSYIHDEKGRKRVEIFYKAAFYDRDAFMRLSSRYHVRSEFPTKYTSVYVVVMDGETEIHRTATFTGGEPETFDAETRLRKEVRAWLDANRPGWDDPVKSWAE